MRLLLTRRSRITTRRITESEITPLRIEDGYGSTCSIEGCGDLQFGNGWVTVMLRNIAHVGDLRYHLSSLTALIGEGHTFEEGPEGLKGVLVELKSTQTLLLPLVGSLHILYGFRPHSRGEDNASTVIAPG